MTPEVIAPSARLDSLGHSGQFTTPALSCRQMSQIQVDPRKPIAWI